MALAPWKTVSRMSQHDHGQSRWTGCGSVGGPVDPPEAARAGLAARAQLARSEGMEPIAEQIIAATLSAETKVQRPAAVAFVRESIMRQPADGYAKHCEALAKAMAADHRMITAPTLLLTGDADVV